MATFTRRQGNSYTPLRDYEQNENQYGSVNNNSQPSSSSPDELDPDGSAPLLSMERLRLSFQPDKSSVYIFTTAVLSLFVLGTIGVILFFGLGRIIGFIPPPGQNGVDPIRGFEIYPSRSSLEAHMRYLTRQPHLAGKSEKLANWIDKRFKSYGLDSEIVTYHTFLNYPDKRRVAIVSPPELVYEAQLREDVIHEDPSSYNQDAVPTFHGYSASGDVTAEIVYVNYGRMEDFIALKKRKISVKGKIALVRYGQVFRGAKVAAAEKFGAIGVLMYTDPEDDGYVRGKVYPDGPYKPGSGVQRGSLGMLSIYPGDPLTPGKPSLKNATRLDRKDAKSIPKIPSLPISYDDAYPLLRALAGEGIQALKLGQDWEGGLNISYWTGPSEAKVNLVNINQEGNYPIQNVITTIIGEEEPDKEIILGNHHDAWVYGASDPGSGTTAMIEIARTLGILLKRGWRPRRTIKLCSWDGEEYGLVGSTEWVEDRASELTKKAVVYLNVDVAEGINFVAEGSTSLRSLLETVSKTVRDPRIPGATLYDNWMRTSQGKLGNLGSGSDYTPFYQHLGIASLNLAFYSWIGIYHSNYDSFHYIKKFGDPEFQTQLTMTELWGKMAVILADEAILPFNLSHHTTSIKAFTEETLERIPMDAQLHGVNFTDFVDTVNRLSESGDNFQSRVTNLATKLKYDRRRRKSVCPTDDPDCRKELDIINDRLAFFERKLLDPNGIPGREFYKHLLLAPSLWKGYESQLYPTLTESIDHRNWHNASSTLRDYVRILNTARTYLTDLY